MCKGREARREGVKVRFTGPKRLLGTRRKLKPAKPWNRGRMQVFPWLHLPISCASLSSPIQVFSSDEEPLHPFSQLSRAKGGQRVRKGPWPALKSRQSVVALHSAALVASRTRAFQEQGQGQEQSEPGMSSTPRLRKVMRQASVDDSREEDKA
jgi:hypothetical protein